MRRHFWRGPMAAQGAPDGAPETKAVDEEEGPDEAGDAPDGEAAAASE